MNVAEIRSTFLNFFENKGHTVVPSAALVPENDPSLFFVNAGMVPFKDLFTGAEQRNYQRACSVQKCMRVSGKHNDLENVGFTARHHTLFEMLGNFSFGDYFKEEAIAAAWEFLTVTMGLPADRLLITVYRDDDESFALWEDLGVPKERIGRCGEKDNFWTMGPTGPCGPCSEIHWDLQDNFVPDNEPDPWGFGHDAGRYMELWNLVFMQYERYTEGEQILQRDLPRPSVDTGMGLERLAAVVNGQKSNWEIDAFQKIIVLAGEVADASYGDKEETSTSLRVIADHARASAFLIGDGVMPSNEGRGYVLRRIMRRAIRHGVKLGINRTFLSDCADRVIEVMSGAYPELAERRDFILKVVQNEEETFRETLDRGLALLDEAFSHGTDEAEPCLPGATVFALHDTYGFPPDLTAVIAGERGWKVDDAGYELEMEQQRARSRASWKGAGGENLGAAYRALEAGQGSCFVGYSDLKAEGRVNGILVGGEAQKEAREGQIVEIVADTTPLYAESGGQVGDTGYVRGPNGRGEVLDCTKPGGGGFVHRVRVTEGSIALGESVELEVDAIRRADIMRNHTATHLLHAALRNRLGAHVQQRGSLVEPSRLRFDFSHFESIPKEALAEIEDLVNEQILADTELLSFETSMDEAVARGAMALFGEKYGERVRVVEVPGFSVELCGGTHCRATGEIGLLKLSSEGGISSGVRRIEAMTGRGALSFLRTLDQEAQALDDLLKARGQEALAKVKRLIDEKKSLRREVEDLKRKLLSGDSGPERNTREVQGVQVLAAQFDDVGGKELRVHGDSLLDQLGRGIVVLGASKDGKASLLVKVSKDLCDSVRAGDLVKELAQVVGGRGGGRPDMAQAGGKEPQKIPEALERAYGLIEETLSSSPN